MKSQSSSVRGVVRSIFEKIEPRLLMYGQLDPTFSGDGQALFTLPNGYSFVERAVSVQADGKVLVAGIAFDPDSESIQYDALVRANSEGTLDKVYVSGSSSNGGANGVEVQQNGKILLSSGAIYRFNPDFTPDLTFGGGDGVAGGGFVIELQPDDKILWGGRGLGVGRLTADGEIDTTFDGDGYNQSTLPGGDEPTEGIVVLNDGRIVVSGPRPNEDFAPRFTALSAYNSDGSIDTTFGDDGIRVLNCSSSNANDSKLSYDPLQNKLLVSSRDNGKLVRVNANGDIDSSFATNGVFSTPVEQNGYVPQIYGSVVTSSGNYVLRIQPFNNALKLFGLRPDGSIDSLFGNSGQIILASGGLAALNPNTGQNIAIAPDGKIVTATAAGFLNVQIYVARLTGDGTLVVNGTAGNDTITFNGSNYVVNGTTIPVDTAYVTRVKINGMGGNDRVTLNAAVSGGPISVFGGAGDDTLVGGNGNDSLDGGEGNDSISGNGGNDTLLGWTGADALFGGNGNDYLAGWTQDDKLTGGAGNDTLFGGSSNDTYFFASTSSNETDSLIEQNAGGLDTLDFSALNTAVTIKLNNDTLATHLNRTVKVQYTGTAGLFENAFGGNGNDLIIGNSKSNLLRGGGGNDTVQGQGGNDTLYANTGSDWLQGGDGNDLLFGADGTRDTLDGGSGTDILGSRDSADVTAGVP